jgi:hypothetical protein
MSLIGAQHRLQMPLCRPTGDPRRNLRVSLDCQDCGQICPDGGAQGNPHARGDCHSSEETGFRVPGSHNMHYRAQGATGNSSPATIPTMRTSLLAGLSALILVGATSAADAGPPATLCQLRTKAWCEKALGGYNAYEFLKRAVMKELSTTSPGVTADGGCGPTPGRRPWFFRCHVHAVAPGLASPCVVEALLSRPKPTVYVFHWRQESASCKV